MITLTEKEKEYVGLDGIYMSEDVELSRISGILVELISKANRKERMRELAGIGDGPKNVNKKKLKDFREKLKNKEYNNFNHENFHNINKKRKRISWTS